MSIQQQKRLRALVLGDGCLDIYHYGKCNKISPEAPVPVLEITEKDKTQEGMVYNVKNNLVSLGFDCSFFTNRKEIRKRRFIDTRFMQCVLRVDEGEEDVDKCQSDYVISRELDYDAVVISDYNKGYLDYNTCEKIVDFYNVFKIPIFVDSKKKDLTCFKKCFIKINEKEKEAATLPEDCKLITTVGERGADYDGKNYPTDKVEVFDVCGAGDVFLSALVYCYVTEKDIE